MNGRALVPILLALAGARCLGQRPEFEVATIKVAHPEGDRINMNLGTIRHERLTLTNATLSDCLKFAYGLVSDAQLSGPGWIKSKEFLYDVVGDAAPGTPHELQLVMLQNLLRDRLKLTLHHEQQRASFLALVPGKNGPKLKEALPNAPSANGPSVPGHIAGPHMAMSTLALLLSRYERETVLDMTGLKGFYEVKLDWTPDDPRMTALAEATEGPSLFTALQEQLGLRLEPRKGPIEVLVVDSADKVPAEN